LGRAGYAVVVTPLDRLRAEASACTRCDLYRDATQTVFGEGPAVHPSAVPRTRPPERDGAFVELAADLRVAAEHLAS
jgi:DNA polymerase